MGDAERNRVIRARLSVNHPNLAHEHFNATSPQDNSYNCLAWAGHDTKRQWHPSAFGGLFWPNGEQTDDLDGWIAAYRTLGYEVCTSPEFEAGKEKLAIYVDALGPSHIARQRPNGFWTSKIGKVEDIEHTLAGLEGGKYGNAVVFLSRTAGDQHVLLLPQDNEDEQPS